MIWKLCFQFLPNDKILNWSKFKSFADEKKDFCTEKKFFYGRVENIVWKGENAA